MSSTEHLILTEEKSDNSRDNETSVDSAIEEEFRLELSRPEVDHQRHCLI